MTDACDILFHDISMVISHGISIPTNFKVMHHLECINLVNNGINYLPIGAGFLPSTVSFTRQYHLHHLPPSHYALASSASNVASSLWSSSTKSKEQKKKHSEPHETPNVEVKTYLILLMEEIPNNHLGWLKPYK